jgi:hypothetical protein
MDDSGEDEVVQAAWRQFRTGTEAQAPSPAPVRPKKPASAGVFSKAAETAETAGSASPGRKPDAAPVSGVSLPEEAAASGPKPAADGETGAGKSLDAARPKTAEGFSARLARLGTLQQALVMAEILGKPKALRADEEL